MPRRVQTRGRKDCATHQEAKSAKGWKSVTNGQARRRAMQKRCPQAFMGKDKKGNLKFPLIPEKGGKGCCIDCRAARVAYSRASRWEGKYPGVAPAIRSRAKRAGCEWAQKPARPRTKRKVRRRGRGRA